MRSGPPTSDKAGGLAACKRVFLAGLAGVALGVAPTHRENAAVRTPWPSESPKPLLAFQPPIRDYPTVGGDILKGTSPADLEAAEAAAIHTEPPAGSQP